jgi:hypothetical protein
MDAVAVLAAHRARLLGAFRGGTWAPTAAAYQAIGPTPLAQLESALRAVESWGRHVTADPAVHAHLDTFVREALDEVAPATGAVAGLAGIFANATAHAGWWAAQTDGTTSYVATCASCGATQQRVLTFTCERCDQPLYPEAP